LSNACASLTKARSEFAFLRIAWADRDHNGKAPAPRNDRYIGYWKPYATSHDELDADEALQEEVRNAARTLAEAVDAGGSGRLVAAGQILTPPRQK